MSSDEQVIREYYEADQALRMKYAEVVSRDDLVALPKDVREARAAVECAEENRARTEKLIAFEQAKADREERWVAAHETSAAMWSVKA